MGKHGIIYIRRGARPFAKIAENLSRLNMHTRAAIPIVSNAIPFTKRKLIYNPCYLLTRVLKVNKEEMIHKIFIFMNPDPNKGQVIREKIQRLKATRNY